MQGHARKRQRRLSTSTRRQAGPKPGKASLHRSHGRRGQAGRSPRAIWQFDEFTSIASHDLKEPLHGIRAYCQALEEDYAEQLDSEGRRRLKTIDQMCDRLGNLVDSLLAYCGVERAISSRDIVDFHVVASEVLEALRPRILQQNASVHIAGPLPQVRGDAPLLATVLGNLVVNGLKFNRSGQPKVEIGCQGSSPCTIYVRDNGIGIPPEHHETIFGMLQRLHSRTEFDGSGMGLAIVRKIVQSHGGNVWVDSQPGQGSTFFFTVRPAEAAAAGSGLPSPHWHLQQRRAKQGRSSRVRR